MSDPKETAAQEALKNALRALARAGELCEIAGFGSQVIGPLSDAQRETNYALATALGRN